MMYRIKRVQKTLVLAYATNATTIVSSAFPINGLLRGIISVAPDLTSTHTYSVTVKDTDGYTIYTKASLAESATSSAFVDANNQPLQLPVSGAHTITIVTSGNQDANRTFSVVLLIEN